MQGRPMSFSCQLAIIGEQRAGPTCVAGQIDMPPAALIAPGDRTGSRRRGPASYVPLPPLGARRAPATGRGRLKPDALSDTAPARSHGAIAAAPLSLGDLPCLR